MNCPHCSVKIEGATTKEEVQRRVQNKDVEITALKTELIAARGKAGAHDGLTTRIAELEGQIEGHARTSSLQEIGITDPKMREGFELVFNSARASNPDLTWADWIGEGGTAREHVLLSSHFTAEAATPTEQTTTTEQTPTPPTLPPGNTGGPQSPPGPAAKLPGAQLTNYFESAAYKALPPAEQRAKLAELRQQHTSSA